MKVKQFKQYICDMFIESFDYIWEDSWSDCLDDNFIVNHIWQGKQLSRLLAMRKQDRGIWIIGQLWNSTSIMPSSLCEALDVPQGCTYARGVRKWKDQIQSEFIAA